MNREQIKLLAIIAMTVNHTAFALVPKGTMLYEIMLDIGYLTAVTMCYFLVEGYYYTSSKVAYMQRLLIVALISQIPYTLALGLKQLNMLFTLLICFVVLLVMDKVKPKILMITLVCILFCMTYYCDWAFKAVTFTVLFNVTHLRCFSMSHTDKNKVSSFRIRQYSSYSLHYLCTDICRKTQFCGLWYLLLARLLV